MKIQGNVLDLVIDCGPDNRCYRNHNHPYSAPKATHCQIQKTILALECDPALNKVEILGNSAC